MNPVIETFRRLIPTRHRVTGRGWITFNCPVCGDRKGRGAFRETVSGGFRYNCKNGGCEYESNTGWEPDNGFFGRPRRLFERMGGSISDIPPWMLKTRRLIERDPTADLEIANDFPQVALPEGSQLLWQKALNRHMRDAQAYVLHRGSLLVEYPFFWSPKYPRYVIYPFEYHHKVIGWIARAIDENNTFRHMKCPNFPTDYMLHQEHAYRNGSVFVQEGHFDAVALNSLCTFGNTISKKQINLLNQVKASRRQVVLIPDHHGDEWLPYWNAAKDNGFAISVPEYPNSGQHIKDAGDSIRQNGLLLTVEAIIDGISVNYVEAQVKLRKKTRGQ